MAMTGCTRKTANDDQADPPQQRNDGTTRRGHNTVPVRRPGRTRGGLGARLQESPTFPDPADRRVGALCATTNNFEGCELLALEIKWQKAKTEVLSDSADFASQDLAWRSRRSAWVANDFQDSSRHVRQSLRASEFCALTPTTLAQGFVATL